MDIKKGNVKSYWSEQMPVEDFIVLIAPLVRKPVNTMHECDGDMWMSDYRDLSEAADRLHLAAEDIIERRKEIN
jgi:hypothetical protein